MKVGIICAGDSEVTPFLPLIKDCSISEKAMLKFYSGTIENVPVIVLFCGVCKTNAAIAAQILIDTYHCDAVINAGTAGGMNPYIKLFDTVISTESAYWDVSKNILTEFHPWAKSVFWKADPFLIETAKNIVSENNLQNIYFGRMITGEMFIEDEYRDKINEDLAPLSVDMETASIAHVCYVNHIPYIAVRTITDTAEHAGVDSFGRNCEKASQIAAGIVKMLLQKLHQCSDLA